MRAILPEEMKHIKLILYTILEPLWSPFHDSNKQNIFSGVQVNTISSIEAIFLKDIRYLKSEGMGHGILGVAAP